MRPGYYVLLLVHLPCISDGNIAIIVSYNSWWDYSVDQDLLGLSGGLEPNISGCCKIFRLGDYVIVLYNVPKRLY